MTFIAIFILVIAFMMLMSISLSNDTWNILRLYKRQSSKRKLLVICIIGYIICLIFSITLASVIIEPEFGHTMATIYAFLAGAGIYFFWHSHYKKMSKKNQVVN